MKVLILGATSTLAIKTAEHFAKENAQIVCVARNEQKLNEVVAHLDAISSGNVTPLTFDFENTQDIPAMLDDCWQIHDEYNLVLVAHGTLTDQIKAEKDFEYLKKEFRVNAESYVIAMSAIANKLEAQHHGTLAVFGSVAGDRGRPSNYLYGCSKTVIEAISEGMRARLFKQGVNLLLIKPGIVRTQMTDSLDDLPEKLVADPDKVAIDIVKAIKKGESSIYTPGYWWLIMTIIKSIPTMLFNRLGL